MGVAKLFTIRLQPTCSQQVRDNVNMYLRVYTKRTAMMVMMMAATTATTMIMVFTVNKHTTH